MIFVWDVSLFTSREVHKKRVCWSMEFSTNIELGMDLTFSGTFKQAKNIKHSWVLSCEEVDHSYLTVITSRPKIPDIQLTSIPSAAKKEKRHAHYFSISAVLLVLPSHFQYIEKESKRFKKQPQARNAIRWPRDPNETRFSRETNSQKKFVKLSPIQGVDRVSSIRIWLFAQQAFTMKRPA